MMRKIKAIMSKNSSGASGLSTDEKSVSDSSSQLREMMGYYIGPTLGQGHFARVKLGIDKSSSEKVALKLIVKDAIGEDSSEFKTVQREVDALSQVSHDNVLKLHKVDWDAKFPKGNDKFEDVAAIVLELAEGGELFDFLLYSGAMSEIVARTYFQQLITGLEHCHQNGVVHRDLKLENVLLNTEYTLKIADFGLAELNVSSEKQKMTQWCGTKRYMAPELHENRSYTLKVDTFACGIILFILLGGYPPFVYATKEDDLYKLIAAGNYSGFWKKHASYDKATFSPEVKDLLNGIFAYDKDQRFGIEQIKAHAWYNGPILSQEQLVEELSTRKAAVDEAKKRGKKDAGSKKPSKLDRLNTEVEAQRDFFNPDAIRAAKAVDLDATSFDEAQPEVWDEEELGVGIYTRFTSKQSATALLNVFTALLGAMKYKFLSEEAEFEITSTLQDPDTLIYGIEEISILIKIFQNENENLRTVVVKRMGGDSFVFQRFFDEFTAALGSIVYA